MPLDICTYVSTMYQTLAPLLSAMPMALAQFGSHYQCIFRSVSNSAFQFLIFRYFFSRCAWVSHSLLSHCSNVIDLLSCNLPFSCFWSHWKFRFVTIGKYWAFVEHVCQGAASNNWQWAHFNTTGSIASRRIARLLFAGNTKWNCRVMS